MHGYPFRRPGFGYDIFGQAASVAIPPPAAPVRVAPAVPVRTDVEPEKPPGLFDNVPQLLVIGVATGAAFALGSGIIHRFVFKNR